MIVSFDSSELVSLVSSIALLTAAQHAVFLHCLKFNPNPAYYSGDVRTISIHLQMHVRTVQRALQVIKADPILSKVVYPSSAKVAV